MQLLHLTNETAITVIGSGAIITATGHFAPLIIIGSMLTTVGAGLLITLDQASGPGEWIGYQVLAGLGIGLCFQVPIMAGQALSPPEDVSSVTALILCEYSFFFPALELRILLLPQTNLRATVFQTMGGAVMVSAGQAAFTNKLISGIESSAPSLEPAQVVAMGATDLRRAFSGVELSAVLAAYTDGIQTALILSIALAGAATLASLLIPWRSIKGKVQTGVGAT